MRRALQGVGLVEFILILASISIISIPLFIELSQQVQNTMGNMSQEISETQVSGCASIVRLDGVVIDNNGVEYVFDSRVNRYRNRQTGRFVRPDMMTIHC